ncbi:MAG: hypothetical protein BV457_00130 [Thermoplasmata archaeon M9B1D]|nr:MAG: hypothetical protein BV457_00130 [Thermoplasmata archaeon M9B1D]PNX52228.1 MAG: hypothetical protein BV456_00165 [Thermoplasmata archaeon M8B2D]
MGIIKNASSVRLNINKFTAGTIKQTDSNVERALLSLDNAISIVVGGVVYRGTWNANTNNPTIVSSTGTKGDYYVVSVEGTTEIDGISNWKVGDWIIFNGSIWQKVDNQDISAVWGNISGNLSNQTDLQNALNLKADDALVLKKDGSVALTANWNAGAFKITAGSLEVSGTNNLILNSETLNHDGQGFKFSDKIFVPSGSVASTSITRSFNINTGIWFSDVDTLNISTGGVERFEIDNTEATFTLPVQATKYIIGGSDVLTSTTLGSNIVNSSLTNVGTLTSLNVDNINIDGNTISATSGALQMGSTIITTGAGILNFGGLGGGTASVIVFAEGADDDFTIGYNGVGSGADNYLWISSDLGASTETFRIYGDGRFFTIDVKDDTTSSSANGYIDPTTGQWRRSTCGEFWKNIIEKWTPDLDNYKNIQVLRFTEKLTGKLGVSFIGNENNYNLYPETVIKAKVKVDKNNNLIQKTFDKNGKEIIKGIEKEIYDNVNWNALNSLTILKVQELEERIINLEKIA